MTSDSPSPSPFKAKLAIILKAGDVVVAEGHDPTLWNSVFAALNSGANELPTRVLQPSTDVASNADATTSPVSSSDLIGRFASSLGVSRESVEAAISPSTEPPYLSLDHHYWEAFKRNTPAKGRGSISPIGLSATLLVLWSKEAKLGISVTGSMANAVLDSLNARDANPSRGIANCRWLQKKGAGPVTINPVEISRAQSLAKAFCEKKAPAIES